MPGLEQMPNIGPEMKRQLKEVDIQTPAQLIQAGSKEAWLRILARDPSACLNRLYGLEGAIQGVRWHNLSEASKAELKKFYHAHKRGQG